MKVFVAGASGTIGVPLVRALVQAGHEVTAMTRTPGKQSMLAALGATPAVADALDAGAVARVVRAADPTHVIHQLTALPKNGPQRDADLAATNRLRDEGTRHLLAAAIDVGAKRFIGGSFALLREAPAGTPRGVVAAIEAIRSMESQILDAARAGRIEGIVLRYGGFYGAGTPMTDDLLDRLRRRRIFRIRNDRGLLPFVHIDDAVSATVAALDRGEPGSTYDIVDDRAVSFSEVVTTAASLVGVRPPRAVPLWIPRLLMPYFAGILAIRLPLSNAAARAELGWRPMYSTVEDGLAAGLRRSASAPATPGRPVMVK